MHTTLIGIGIYNGDFLEGTYKQNWLDVFYGLKMFGSNRKDSKTFS